MDGWRKRENSGIQILTPDGQRFEVTVVDVPAEPGRTSRLVRWTTGRFANAARWSFGLACLIVALAILSAVPIVKFIALGVLLEAGGRVARNGTLRGAVPGIDRARRLGIVGMASGILFLPTLLLYDTARDSAIIDPTSSVTWTLWVWTACVFSITLLHVLVSIARGGRPRYFIGPLGNILWLVGRRRQRPLLLESRESMERFFGDPRLGYYLWLGLRGFAGALAWLAIPSALLAAGKTRPVVGVIGGLLLMLVVIPLPFLQIRMAAENRLGAMFDRREIRQRFARAPIAFLFSLSVTLLFSLPLYLLKIEIVPRDAIWLESLVFIATILPLKLLVGWSYHRASRREQTRRWWVRWPARFLTIPVAALYAYIVFLTQYTGWRGALGIFEQHAFLLPAPF